MHSPFLTLALRCLLALPLLNLPCRAARVAVLDFGTGAEAGSLAFLSQTLPSALIEPLSAQPGIEVVERSQLAKILQEQQLSLTGAVLSDSERALVPADILVMGQYGGRLEALQVQVRVVDGKSGAVRGAFSRQGSLQDILSAMPTIAAQVAVAARGETSGTLTLRTTPSGAAVWLDGRPLGRTPLVDQKIAAGSHHLRIELAGHRDWSDSVTIEPSTPAERVVSLEVDDDRSGLWLQGGGSMGSFARAFEDPRGPVWSGDLGLLARSRRVGVQMVYEFPTERGYDVSYPVPWSVQTSTRTLTGPMAHLQVVADALQSGPAAIHLGAGLTYTFLEVSPLDHTAYLAETKEVGLLGAIGSVGIRWRLHRLVEILAETQASTTFDEVTVTDIAERDLFTTTSTTSQFTLQSWSARVAARFRIL